MKRILTLITTVAKKVGKVLILPFTLFRYLLRRITSLCRTFLHFSWKKKLWVSFLSCCVIGLVSLILVAIGNISVVQSTKSQIFTLDSLPGEYEVGIILGAKVYSDGGLSGMTKDRSDRAIELYQKKKVKKLLVSGDHGRNNYDEVNSIKNYLLKNGIPAEDLFLDHAGFDTYDSIYRARDIFQVKSAVIITQGFHLPRAVFIADKLGLTVVGVPADIQNYGHMERVIIREKIAVMKAWTDIILHNKPKFLGETIPLTGDSKKSWDRDK